MRPLEGTVCATVAIVPHMYCCCLVGFEHVRAVAKSLRTCPSGIQQSTHTLIVIFPALSGGPFLLRGRTRSEILLWIPTVVWV